MFHVSRHSVFVFFTSSLSTIDALSLTALSQINLLFCVLDRSSCRLFSRFSPYFPLANLYLIVLRLINLLDRFMYLLDIFLPSLFSLIPVLARETRDGWPLLTVEWGLKEYK